MTGASPSQPMMDDLPVTPWEAGGVTKDRFVTAGTEREGIFSLGDVNIFPASGPGPVAIAAGAEIAAQIVESVNSHAALKARIHELESNEAAYESILGKRTYNEVAEDIAALVKALEDLDTLLDFSDESVDSTWHFDSTDAIQNAFNQAYAVLRAHRSAKT